MEIKAIGCEPLQLKRMHIKNGHTLKVYRDTGGSGLVQCGSGETTVSTSNNTWQVVPGNGNEATGCSFSSASANQKVVFKINLKANSNASAYVANLSFTTTGQ